MASPPLPGFGRMLVIGVGRNLVIGLWVVGCGRELGGRRFWEELWQIWDVGFGRGSEVKRFSGK